MMKTKQAVFLLGVNIISFIAYYMALEAYLYTFRHWIQTIAHIGGGAGRLGLFANTMLIGSQDSYVVETVVSYPIIFAFWFAGINILMISIFLLWNRKRT